MANALRMGFAVTGFVWWTLFGRVATVVDDALSEVWEPFLDMDA